MFSCEYCKVFNNSFFIEHLGWLLLQVLYKKDVPKNFANFTRMHHCMNPFLSSCRSITCNFVKKEGPVQVYCCKFYEKEKRCSEKFRKLHENVSLRESFSVKL